MNAIKLLSQDHRKVEQLFVQLEGSSSARKRAELVDELVEEVLTHAHAEEQVLYPLARERLEGAEDLVNTSLEEHEEVEQRLLALLDMDPDSEAFLEQVAVVREMIEAHVEEEEGRLFPLLEDTLEEEDLENLAEELEQAKEEEEEAERAVSSRGRRRSSREPTKQELYEEAKRKDLPGRSKMTKEELERELGA